MTDVRCPLSITPHLVRCPLTFWGAAFTMSLPQPVPAPTPRRKLFLDVGGVNLINNLALLYTRAQGYLGARVMENDDDSVSPLLTLPTNIDRSSVPHHGHNHIRTFSFPSPDLPTEEHPLLSDAESVRTSYLVALPTGNSLAPHTLFNSVNTLIGIGMLSLPFALHLCGWVVGLALLTVSAIITTITAMILAGVIRKYPNLSTYGDIATAYGGKWVGIGVTGLFVVDLLGATLSLMILFSDSFRTVLGGYDQLWKAVIVVTVFILSFVPLHLLLMLSAVGIVCTLAIITVIVSCGFMVSTSPGSLIVWAPTNMWPVDTKLVFLSLGLILSVWGGHPVFPELYRDMRHPHKFNKTTKQLFSVTYVVDASIAIVGFAMYGTGCQDLIVKNLMANTRYPGFVNPTLCVLMGLLPFSKLPLVTRPLITVYEGHLGLGRRKLVGVAGNTKRVVARVVFCGVLYTISLFVTLFGKVVSFLGLGICFTICIVLPFLCYLRFFEPSPLQRIGAQAAIVIGIFGAVTGTWASVTMTI